LKVPATVGVPEIVITLLDHDALTPSGKPDAMPIPVAPVVLWVIFVNGLLIQTVGVDELFVRLVISSWDKARL